MGWFSKFLGYLGGGIAAPFTGGASMAWALGIGAGVDAATSIYGAHKAGSAEERALKSQEDATADAMELERDQMAEDKRRWDRDEAFRAEQWAASEEDRLFRLALDRYQQELLVARDARAQPYREASRAAMGRLGDILGIDFDPGELVNSPVWRGGGLSGAHGADLPLPAANATQSPSVPRPGMTTGDVLNWQPRAVNDAPATAVSYAPVNPVPTFGDGTMRAVLEFGDRRRRRGMPVRSSTSDPIRGPRQRF